MNTISTHTPAATKEDSVSILKKQRQHIETLRKEKGFGEKVVYDIQDLYNRILSVRQDYGVYWILNKLAQKKIVGESYEGECLFITWVSNRDADFILPKIANSYKFKTIAPRTWECMFQTPDKLKVYVKFKLGNNNNAQISLKVVQYY